MPIPSKHKKTGYVFAIAKNITDLFDIWPLHLYYQKLGIFYLYGFLNNILPDPIFPKKKITAKIYYFTSTS